MMEICFPPPTAFVIEPGRRLIAVIPMWAVDAPCDSYYEPADEFMGTEIPRPQQTAGGISPLKKTRKTHMSRRCELTGKGPMTGNNVSHANNKTKRRFLPNLNEVTLQSETLDRGFRLRISAAALRTVDHRGGLDAFLAKAKDSELSANALKIKKDIAKAQAAA